MGVVKKLLFYDNLEQICPNPYQFIAFSLSLSEIWGGGGGGRGGAGGGGEVSEG